MKNLTIPKLCGGDIELGNFMTGLHSPDGTGSRAAIALLRKIKGVAGKERLSDASCDCAECRARREQSRQWSGHGASSSGSFSGYGGYNPQDWMRTFLPCNGGCFYIDLEHLEVCLPEVLSARDHVAAWNAMLRIARQAQAAANAELPEGQKIHVLANNIDGHGNSHGSHLDFLITRRAFHNIFSRRLHYLLHLAAYQVSSMVFTGQGKAGCERRAAGENPCAYQISQRADFIATLAGQQTTFNRPIVNSRDEPLCGGGAGGADSPAHSMARLHVIFYDSTLCHVSSFLKVGVMQIILAMIEAEKINPRLILEDPVAAVGAWSRDPLLSTRLPLASGEEVTAVELQLLFLEEAAAFVESGGCDGIVPEAEKIIALWTDTLLKLKACDFAALAPRLDWVLKSALLERAMKQRAELDWASAEIGHLDHFYSALDGGLYQACERQGAVERVVTEEEIQRRVAEPPEDTRAYARSRLLRIGGAHCVHVDWDEVTFSMKRGWPSRRTISLSDPLGFTKQKAGFLETATLEDALDILGSQQPPALAPITAAPLRHPRGFSIYQPKPPNPSKP